MGEIIANGWNGNIRFSDGKLTIEKFRPKNYAFDFGGQGETVFRLDGDSTQRFKEAKKNSIRMWGIGKAGFYSIATSTSPLVGGQSVDAKWASFPSVVIFESDANEQFTNLRDAVEAEIERLRMPVSNLADNLSILDELHKAGVLTTDEFKQAKTRFIGSPPDSAAQAAGIIRQLSDLHRAGALTDSEFRQKKWDILSKS